ncbi:MAG: creatininase family protein [Chloroflexi bacterium]|nr:creatininase family protein [Chloroflexota bacterium]
MTLKYYEHSLAELPWRVAEAALKETDLVIVPLGSVEVYGHLPQGTDGIAAEAIADAVARAMKALRTPLIPVGTTPTLAAFPGTLSVRREAMETLLRDMVFSLVKSGARRFFFVNGHAGNNDFVNAVMQELSERGAKGATIQVWSFARSHDQELFKNYNPHGHASEAGTSVMLYLRPDLVDASQKMYNKPTLSSYQDFTFPIDARERMPDGMHGDTSEASAEKGKVLFDRMIKRICDFIAGWK